MIKIINLSKKYGDFYALKDINLTLPSKGLIGVSGESESGKTNFIQSIFIIVRIKNKMKKCLKFIWRDYEILQF